MMRTGRFRYHMLCLLALLLTSCIGSTIEKAVQPHTELFSSVLVLSNTFYIEFDRWPATVKELNEYSEKQNISFDK